MPDFDFQTSLTCQGLEVEFTNLSNNSSYVLWSFGDGTTSAENNPSHIYPFNNTYTVTLSTGVNSKCLTDSSAVIQVLDFDQLFNITISNVLTPNGDGINDFFEVVIPGKTNECTSISIFNRWGQEVFFSDKYSTRWDGRTPQGNLVPAGTYFYVIDINGATYKGSLTVIR